jgi:hypothetical protein
MKEAENPVLPAKHELKGSYAVFTMSIKKRFVTKQREKDPDTPNLIIFIWEAEKFDEVIELPKNQHARSLGLKSPRKYKGVVRSEGVEYFETKVEACIRAKDKEAFMRESGRKVAIHGDAGNPVNCVYVIRLLPGVWLESKFLKQNEWAQEMDEDERMEIPAFYVGQTSKTPDERFKEHVDPDSPRKTSWGCNFFIEPFSKAYQADLLKQFEQETQKATDELSSIEAVIREYELAEWLRANNFGAYSA